MSGHFTITQLARIFEENVLEALPPDVNVDEQLITVPFRLYTLMNARLQELERENKAFRKVYFGNRYN